MRTSPRRVAAVAVVAAVGGLVLAAAPAQAVVDPIVVLECLTGSLADPAAVLADPAGVIAIPPEVPLVSCLAP